MISIPFVDILQYPEFEGLNEVELLPVKMDSKVLPYLFKHGMDVKQGYYILANKLRDKKGNVSTGLRYIGSQRLDKEFRQSPFCGLTEKIIMAAHKDLGFAMDLAKMSSSTIDYNSLVFLDYVTFSKPPLAEFEESWDSDAHTITTLNTLVFTIRGSPYNAAGNPKTHKEYIETNCK